MENTHAKLFEVIAENAERTEAALAEIMKEFPIGSCPRRYYVDHIDANDISFPLLRPAIRRLRP